MQYFQTIYRTTKHVTIKNAEDARLAMLSLTVALDQIILSLADNTVVCDLRSQQVAVSMTRFLVLEMLSAT
jgi:hypothetical protein